MLVQVPKLVLHGFKGISETEAVMLNCPTEVYDYENPDELRFPAHSKDILYDWEREDK